MIYWSCRLPKKIEKIISPLYSADMIEINLPNCPVAWNVKIGKRGVYNPHAKQKNFTRWQLKSFFRDSPLRGYVVVEFLFSLRIPASTSKKKRAMMLAGEIRPTNMDTTNCQKFQEDCIKNILIEDDRMVVRIMSEKIYGKKENILIKVWSLAEYNESGNR